MISGVLGICWVVTTVYGFFAVTIGQVLLGSGDDGGTLEALAIFAIGFIARPSGVRCWVRSRIASDVGGP